MVPFSASRTLLAESWTFSQSALVWPLFPAIETRFFFSVHCDFIHFLFNSDVRWCLVLHFCGKTSGIFECLG